MPITNNIEGNARFAILLFEEIPFLGDLYIRSQDKQRQVNTSLLQMS